MAGQMPGQSTMFVPFMSHNLVRSMFERKANGLAYSRCLANANDLATPLLPGVLGPFFCNGIV